MASEKRLIDANALRQSLESKIYWGQVNNVACLEAIDDAPTVDAVEVVHGRWLYDSGSGKYFCSACNADALSFKKDTLYGGDLYDVCLTDYCPNCGAKMDGGNEDVGL